MVEYVTAPSPLHASGLAAGSDEGSASTRVAGNPSCTCHLVPAPSAALAAIFAVVIQRLRVVFLQPASCVPLPASYSIYYSVSCFGSRPGPGRGTSFPPGTPVAEACLAVRVLAPRDPRQNQHLWDDLNKWSAKRMKRDRKGKGKKEKNTTLLERVSSVSEFGRFQDFGPGREAAFRPLGIHSAAVRP